MLRLPLGFGEENASYMPTPIMTRGSCKTNELRSLCYRQQVTSTNPYRIIVRKVFNSDNLFIGRDLF